LMQDGLVYALGANKAGQCGIRTTGDTVPRPRKCVVVDENNTTIDVVTRMIACGDDFSVLLDTEGFVYSTGSSEYGQLGNGETGEYFIQANKLAFANCNVFTRRTDHWYYHPSSNVSSSSQPNLELELLPDAGSIRIQAIACGKHHTIALEAESSEKPRLFSWVSLNAVYYSLRQAMMRSYIVSHHAPLLAGMRQLRLFGTRKTSR
jgi:alpha-tubulin suppressor-like RCC1 family protein